MKKKKSELYRNEIKSYIVRAGMTMSEVVDYLADEYGWSSSVPNLSGKLKRGSLCYEWKQGADQAGKVRAVSGSGYRCVNQKSVRQNCQFPMIQLYGEPNL